MTSAHQALGVDLGGTNLRVARITPSGEVIDRITRRVPDGRLAQMEIIEESILSMISPEVIGVGIGFPGRVRMSDGLLLSAGFLQLDQVPLGDRIRSITGLPVTVDNDAYMATYAEMKVGAAAGKKNILTFTIGTGIGGAVAIDGKLYYGSSSAGQFGHVTTQYGGKLCKCGRRGCVETLSSGTALRELIIEANMPPETRVEDLFVMEDSGNEAARALLTRWVSPLEMAIESMVAVFGPDIVLLGGGLGKAAFKVLNGQRTFEHSPWFDFPVATCSLGDPAGVIGAGLRMFE